MDLKGRLLGNRYEIIEKIGSGGMATVYRAKCHVLNRYVAIKILRDEFTTDEEFIKRFEVDIFTVGSDWVSHFDYLKEYCDGELNVVHKPDDEIVLDAHDLALSKMFDLYFITADKKLLRFANDILDLTKIKEMYFVEDAFYKI